MVKFLLDAGADQEHKTDEMHTALMEASMDGHVEVARLLLDHGAQVRVVETHYSGYQQVTGCISTDVFLCQQRGGNSEVVMLSGRFHCTYRNGGVS